jgi:hypothetical protein
MFPTDEVKKTLEDPMTFLRALVDCVKICPGLKPTAIAKMLEAYQTRLKESFGIMEGAD